MLAWTMIHIADTDNYSEVGTKFISGGGGWGAVYSMDLASSLSPKFTVVFNDIKVQLNMVWGL